MALTDLGQPKPGLDHRFGIQGTGAAFTVSSDRRYVRFEGLADMTADAALGLLRYAASLDAPKRARPLAAVFYGPSPRRRWYPLDVRPDALDHLGTNYFELALPGAVLYWARFPEEPDPAHRTGIIVEPRGAFPPYAADILARVLPLSRDALAGDIAAFERAIR